MRLELNDCRQLLVKVSEKMPSLFLDMAEIVNRSTSTESSEPTEPTRSLDSPNNKLTWCVCGHCAQMTSEMENICCGMQPRACLSQLPLMDIYILDQMVLHLQQVYIEMTFLHYMRKITTILIKLFVMHRIDSLSYGSLVD